MPYAQADPSLPKIVSIQNSYSMLVRSDFESGLMEVRGVWGLGSRG